MDKFTDEEKQAIKGYIQCAVNYLNAESRSEGAGDTINDIKLYALLKQLDVATEDLTPQEAFSYYKPL